MAYLGISHLAIGEANFFTGSNKDSSLVLCQKVVEEGFSGKSNRACFIIRADTKSIDDDQQYFLEWLIQSPSPSRRVTRFGNDRNSGFRISL